MTIPPSPGAQHDHQAQDAAVQQLRDETPRRQQPTTGDRRARGVAAYARVFGVPQDDVPAMLESQVGPLFADESFVAAGGTGWWGETLTDRDRAIAVITALVSQGVVDARLSAYVGLASREGLDLDAVTELMILLSGYLGFARTSIALHAIRQPTQTPGDDTP